MTDEERSIVRREFARQAALGAGGLIAVGLVAPPVAQGSTSSAPNGIPTESPAESPASSCILTVRGDDTDRRTRAASVQKTICEASSAGADYVLVPPNFGPAVGGYEAAAVDFNDDVRMLRECTVLGACDVKAYGAAGNYQPHAGEGVDDTAAINAAADAVRAGSSGAGFLGDPALSAGTYAASPILCFPPGLYRCDGNLWFGVDRSAGHDLDDGVKNVVAHPGAVIVSRNKGGVAVDLSGVLGARWENLTVWGDSERTPAVGLLLARSGPGAPPLAAAEHWFRNVRVIGNFSLASVYNYASEINHWSHCELRNREPGSECVFLCTRDNSTRAVASPNTHTQTDAGQSNFAPTFVGCRFHFDVEGTASNALFVAESSAGGPKFLGCYFDLLQGADRSPPVLRERSGGSVHGSEARSTGIVLRDCVVEADYDAVLRIEGLCRGVTVDGCTIGGPPDTADVVVAEGAGLHEAHIQSHRADTRIDRITYRVDGNFQRFQNRGMARIGEGHTRVAVRHGMDGSEMGLEDIVVTPTNDLGRAARFWICDLDSRRFVIEVDRDPGRPGAAFVWRAEIR